MDLTQDVLRGMLATIFAVDPMYVLPRQGNWFNPQDMLPTAEKPKTWVAFDIEFDKPLLDTGFLINSTAYVIAEKEKRPDRRKKATVSDSGATDGFEL